MMECRSGAFDTVNFQRSIGRGYLPLASSLEYEGIFNELYFDVGREHEKVLAPKYSYCRTEDPFSHNTEHYLAIGLTSKYDGDGIVVHGRRPFNLVVAVDISGSMASPLSGDDARSKIAITINTIFSILALLKPDDKFGVVLFNDDVSVLQNLDFLEKIDVSNLKKKLLDIKPSNGTALTSALRESTRLFEHERKNASEYRSRENTILFMTDFTPGKDASTNTFIKLVRANAQERLYTSVIGIGAEFSSDILKKMGKIRCCNYFSVHSAQDFKKIIDVNLVYVLSPLAFDVSLKINSDQFIVERVYGSPGNDLPSDRGILIECIGPSAVDESNKIKGGVVVAKLQAVSDLSATTKLSCRLQFEDRDGVVHEDEQDVEVPASSPSILFQGKAIRKAVLLVRYVNISKHWMLDENRRFQANEQEDVSYNVNNNSPQYQPTITTATGITPPPLDQADTRKQKKRVPFAVDPHYHQLISAFLSHYKSEIAEIGDEKLEPYIETMQKLVDFKDTCCETSKDAISSGHPLCINALLKSGTDVPFTPDLVDRVLPKAIDLGLYSLLEAKWGDFSKASRGALRKAIESACKSGRPKSLRRLLTIWTEDTAQTLQQQIGESLLGAIKKGDVEVVRIMIEKFPNLDVNLAYKNDTPLQVAYNFGKSQCAKFLLDHGARPNGIPIEDILQDLSLEGGKDARNQLDLIFVCDCTGSMGSYLESAKKSIKEIVSGIVQMGESHVRFGLVQYRDHPPQENTFVTEVHDFTSSLQRMKAYVDTMRAAGGGDGPECLVDGMEACLNFDYRPNAIKVVCIISDAPPHGLGDPGDGFPEGCPCGHDPLEVARVLAERGIVLYSLGVEPAINNITNLRAFLKAIAQITEGQFVPLTDSSGLKDVIVGGAMEEISLSQATDKVREEFEKLKSQNLDDDLALLMVAETLKKQDVKVKQLVLTSQSGTDENAVNTFIGANNLEEARKQLPAKKEKTTSSGKAEFKVEEKVISLGQVERIWNRLNTVK